MVLKIYKYRGSTFQFEEGKQPVGAVEVKPEESVKARKPANKSRKPADK